MHLIHVATFNVRPLQILQPALFPTSRATWLASCSEVGLSPCWLGTSHKFIENFCRVSLNTPKSLHHPWTASLGIHAWSLVGFQTCILMQVNHSISISFSMYSTLLQPLVRLLTTFNVCVNFWIYELYLLLNTSSAFTILYWLQTGFSNSFEIISMLHCIYLLSQLHIEHHHILPFIMGALC